MTTTEKIANAFLQGLAGQDADALGQLFADEIDWFVPGTPAVTSWSGQRSRRSEVPDYFRTLWAALEPGGSSVSVDAVVIDGENAVVFTVFAHIAATTGRPFRTAAAMRLTVTNGLIRRFHLYEDTAAVAAAFTT